VVYFAAKHQNAYFQQNISEQAPSTSWSHPESTRSLELVNTSAREEKVLGDGKRH
jgi:hypothetical protein